MHNKRVHRLQDCNSNPERLQSKLIVGGQTCSWRQLKFNVHCRLPQIIGTDLLWQGIHEYTQCGEYLLCIRVTTQTSYTSFPFFVGRDMWSWHMLATIQLPVRKVLLPYSGKVWWGKSLANLLVLSIWREKFGKWTDSVKRL